VSALDTNYQLWDWPADDLYHGSGRKIPEYQGGFLLDGGIHFVAALRLLLGAAGHRIAQLACFSALNDKKLVPTDTLHAILGTENGSSGTLTISFGAEFKSGLEVEIVTTNGAVTWNPVEIKTVSREAREPQTETMTRTYGVKEEMEAFGKSLANGSVDIRQTPEEALNDLRVLQALLESGENSGGLKTFS
jgi:predicted dehydrogenase